MKKVKKSEIKQAVETALSGVLEQLEVSNPSKKTRKAISKVSKKIKGDVKKAVKAVKKSQKATKTRNGKSHAKAEASAA